jgi:hypothetical protein
MSDYSQSLLDRLTKPGPKKILALDGGGIRGAVTLGYLGEMERILSERYADYGLSKREDFRLHHYFDLVGGTSTGAIIAALIAVKGASVAEMKKYYSDLGKDIFSDKNGLNIFGKQIYLHGKYDSEPLKRHLKDMFGDSILGDESNKTGLCVVTKRLDTSSTWPVTNNPKAKYFEQNRFPIREIVRASTAAPSYFDPEAIDVGNGENGIFVDGGLSLMNNPSLQLFLIATLKGFKLGWETGEDKMFIVSVGTGRRTKNLIGNKWKDPSLLDIAQQAPEQFMSDASEMVELMMYYIGKGMGVRRQIDAEVGDLAEDNFCGGKACSYLRYNLEIVKEELDKIGMTGLKDDLIESLIQMDRANNVDRLIELGEKAAKYYVKPEHLGFGVASSVA